MSLQKYEILLKAVETGSLTKVGEQLNLTQSAVSHAISSLEQELGLTLLIRNRSGVRLTSSGERLIPYFQGILQLKERLYQEIALIKGLVAGTVKLGVFSSVSIQWLPGMVKAFNSKFPHIEVKLYDGHYQEIEQWLATGQVDLGFVSLPTLQPLDVTELKKDRMLCVLPPGHALAGQSSICLDQIINEPFIIPISGCDTDVRRIFMKYKGPLNIKYELENDHVIMSMVEQGLGISILPEMVLAQMPYNLCLRPLEGEHYRTIGLAAISRDNLSPAAAKMFQFITERIHASSDLTCDSA
ncbi:LysR family transcriptional regulator [Paenibacillus macerans]|uniref:Bacterial regulatory helix-turn-helix, lysR family protein n=1 Tax=Paenibacillus macerans TaxID=44252 RepID=A0A090YS84_PAEMA|nr:LysR family transcriptional regulator [Paenibacillus macerans]KFM94975.1 bacterial regulatory helix-turn-helix, lysR family protein [Paenibacillus macerans]MCY7560437.1 LysR family transcriptional regulator [Paenibacillus macerans]MEC0135591.1 LysR family transcriptional regulator [Paenibacillus macerans]MEC0153440.1 LysR family transcriptional regulator [Paenibacillus macerans]MEC0331939.1 LysR family transcriptional regulator [Paenibacillus macerans]